jgi:pilus assembly protein FimV
VESEALAPAAETEEPAASAAPTPAASPPADEPSLVDRVLGAVAQPIVWGSAIGIVVLVALLAFLRRRRESDDDVTGQWEALEAEMEGETDHAATTRMRATATESDMVVVEGHDGDITAEERALGATAEIPRFDPGTTENEALTLPAEAVRAGGRRAEPGFADQTLTSQTMSSQTVINLDQADPIAEADFHMAYGLYDQAADLISKALAADPDNRALKLKLLEVYFVWGNKEAFLESAQALKQEIRGGSDWDKVVIMGKQICPDESLFAEATASAGEVDLDLASSADGPGLDFAFDEAEDDKVDLSFGAGDGGLSLEASGARARQSPRDRRDDDMLDIGAQTQAGLEAALLEDLDERGAKTTPGSDLSDLESTMESPTVETRGTQGTGRFASLTLESPTIESLSPDAPTVETPTIESPAAGFRDIGDTMEQPRPAGRRNFELSTDMTAEIDLADLGLDIGDLKDMGDEVIDLSGDAGDDEILSATGVTKVLRDDTVSAFSSTAILGNDDATMMAPGFSPDSTGVRTEVLEQPVGNFDPDLPATEDDLDLNLDDFSSALDGGAETAEQPMASRFSGIDLDVGADVPGDDEPTGTEEYSPLDPQTMTEVGTKLDLARAYIDMGDPEGAKSILEEVLSEGDAGQRSEAQALIDALPA